MESETLTRAARKICTNLGHDLEPFRSRFPNSFPLTKHANCMHCKSEVFVNGDPSYLGTRIGGMATALSCAKARAFNAIAS